MRCFAAILFACALASCSPQPALAQETCTQTTRERIEQVKAAIDSGQIRGGYIEGKRAADFAREAGISPPDFVFLVEMPDGSKLLGYGTGTRVCYGQASDDGVALFTKYHGARI